MKFIQFFSSSAVIFIVGFVVIYGVFEKKNVFEIFAKGVVEGEKIVVSLFPTWLRIICCSWNAKILWNY